MSYGIDATSATGFTVKPFDIILSEMIARAKEYYGEGIDLRSTSDLYKFIESLAMEESNRWLGDERAWLSMWIRTATGQALDFLADDMNLSRQQAQYAEGTVTFTVTAALTIPAGSTVRTSTNIWFVTDIDLVFAGAGSDDVTITAQTAGENGVVNATDIDTIDPAISNVTVVNNAAATTRGSDRETDDELRVRLLRASRSNRTAPTIASAVNNIEGVRNCDVRENFPTEYQFTIYVAPDTAGAVTPGDPAYDATLYQLIIDAIKSYRSICADPIIVEASSININITGDVDLLPTYDLAAINIAAFNTINGYIQSLGLGDNVLWTEIVHYIMAVTGIYDVDNVQINALGIDTDQPIAAGEIAVLNVVTLT